MLPYWVTSRIKNSLNERPIAIGIFGICLEVLSASDGDDDDGEVGEEDEGNEEHLEAVDHGVDHKGT